MNKSELLSVQLGYGESVEVTLVFDEDNNERNACLTVKYDDQKRAYVVAVIRGNVLLDADDRAYVKILEDYVIKLLKELPSWVACTAICEQTCMMIIDKALYDLDMDGNTVMLATEASEDAAG